MNKIANMRHQFLIATAMIFPLCAAQNAFAQQHADAQLNEDTMDIVVSARKRDETSIAVPVTITAVGAAELSRRGINSLEGISRLVPTLNIADGGGTIQGGTISLRGIAGPDTNPFGDQAVSFNIDNVQVAKSSVRRLANFDVAQVEVLKGPQTLFFGKNSPGGVISMKTADPTSDFQAKLSAGYEFNAQEIRTEGYISGPLSDALGARLAFFTSDMRGWVSNIAAQNRFESPKYRHGPRNTELGLRGTLAWNPTARFNAKLKASYSRAHGAGPASNFQYFHCPYGGKPQYSDVADECRANDKVSHGDMGSVFGQYDANFRDGVPYTRTNQQLVSLEMNYDLSDNLTLTSVTGFYRVNYKAADTFIPGPSNVELPFFGRPVIGSAIGYSDRELTEEVRLQSNFEGPVNFTFGGLYQTTKATTRAHTFANPVTPIEFNQYYFEQKGDAHSIFGQVSVKLLPTLELSGGARYSYEQKKLPVVLGDITGSIAGGMKPIFPDPTKVKFNNLSPEATLSFRPTNDLTIFGSYKEGFLSGGFNASSVDLSASRDLSYGPQGVKGFEGGVKAALFNRTLRINVAAYSYKIVGLQITSFQNTVGTIRNAGSVRVSGLEADVNYRPPVEGLSLRASGSYNKGKYLSYFAPCYTGQTVALGCSIVRNGSQVQDLSGTMLRNAPKWTWTAGFNYEFPVGDDFKIGISGDANYTSKEITDAKSTPGAVSPSRTLIDASIRLTPANEGWELALVGRNLTDKYYWATSQEVFPNAVGPLSDLYAVIGRGREMMVRASYKF